MYAGKQKTMYTTYFFCKIEITFHLLGQFCPQKRGQDHQYCNQVPLRRILCNIGGLGRVFEGKIGLVDETSFSFAKKIFKIHSFFASSLHTCDVKELLEKNPTAMAS